MVERQDPDNFTRFQTRERCALEIAAYVFNDVQTNKDKGRVHTLTGHLLHISYFDVRFTVYAQLLIGTALALYFCLLPTNKHVHNQLSSITYQHIPRGGGAAVSSQAAHVDI